MTYLLQIYSSTAMSEYEALSQEEKDAITGEYMTIAQAPGVLGGNQLQPLETATTVRVRDGETLTTDGPFAETKEFLGGYFLYEADDLDAAIELAARIPAARMGGSVEVRPIVER
ncbi:MAG TPA: YciI family protein [Solirubrobacteraceae bacterium]|nr:YciI family protein [Solirubrobacteraceae bacterium]